MKTNLLLLSVLFSLAACGGGSDGSSSSPAPAPVPAPSPAPTPSPTACTNSPVVTAATQYFGVMPNGLVGQWQFDTKAGTASYSLVGNTTSATMTRDDATCSYTTSQTGSLRTAFASNGLGVTAADYNGVQTPAFLISSPETDVSQLAGTYNVVRYTTEVTTSTSITSDYATFNVDASGNWAMCPNASYSTSCGGPSGTLSAHGSQGFDINLNGVAVGTLMAKVSGSSKVFVVAINNGTQSDLVTGMWVGSTDAFTAGTYDGSYITNSTDPSTDTVTFNGLTGTVGTQTATLVANSPVAGMFSVGTGSSPNVGIVSSLGVYASVAQSSDASAYVQFGMKETN